MNNEESISRLVLKPVGFFVVRARSCFWDGVFRVPKNGIPETNKPFAMRVVEIALAYSKKPPML